MSEGNARDGDQPMASGEEEFIERNVLINPNVIVNYWKKDEKPFHYYKRWRHLSLHLEIYEFAHSYRFLSTDPLSAVVDTIDEMREDQGLEPVVENEADVNNRQKLREFRQLAERAMEDFDSLGEDEQSDFRWAHMKEVQPHQRHGDLRLVGWADIEQAREIKVFTVDTTNEPDARKYKKTFHRMKINLREVEKNHVGKLLHWTEKLRQYDDDDLGEDYLLAEMYVKEGTLAELEQEIRQRGGNVPLKLFVEVHLFQNEIDESLAEPYHFQNYNMLYDTPSSIFLNSIYLGAEPRAPSDEDDYDSLVDDEKREQLQNPNAKFRDRLLGVVSNSDTSLRHINIALWALVVLMLISLFA